MSIAPIKCYEISIKSNITPETVWFKHYPDGDKQLHIHIIQGISGKSIFLTEADAHIVKDFLNKYY